MLFSYYSYIRAYIRVTLRILSTRKFPSGSTQSYALVFDKSMLISLNCLYSIKDIIYIFTQQSKECEKTQILIYF